MAEAEEQTEFERLQALVNQMQDRLNALLEAQEAQAVPVPVEQEVKVVFAPRERKVRKFSGTPTEEYYPVQDFLQEIQSVFDARRMTPAEQADYIISNLEGSAREEVRYRTAAERRDPRRLQEILERVFGEKLNSAQLLARFHNRRQEPGETLQQFCHQLMQIGSRIKAVGGNVDHLIGEIFAENVRDIHLRRELKRLKRERPAISLFDLREAAILWADGEEDKPVRRSAGLCQMEVTEMLPTDKVTELQAIVEKQQRTLDDLVASMKKLLEAPSSGDREGRHVQEQKKSTKRPSLRDDQGRFICYYCKKPGHIKRDCSERKQGGVVSRREAHANVRSTDTAENCSLLLLGAK